MKNLYKVAYYIDSQRFETYCVAENEEDVIDNYPKKIPIEWELLETDITIIENL